MVRHKGRELVVADIPGLIEGAAEGAGIGDRFLGHVERCQVLLHLVDAAGEDPLEAWETVNGELEAYGAGLSDKPQVVGLNKIDLLDGQERAEVTAALEEAGAAAVLPLSGAAGDGVDEVLDALLGHLARAAKAKAKDEVAEWRP